VQLQPRFPAAGHSRPYPLMRRARAHACSTALSYFPQAYRGKCRGGGEGGGEPGRRCPRALTPFSQGLEEFPRDHRSVRLRACDVERARTYMPRTRIRARLLVFTSRAKCARTCLTILRFGVCDRERSRLAGKHLAAHTRSTFIRGVALWVPILCS